MTQIMNTKTSKTWAATIYIAGQQSTIEDVCRMYVMRGLCVTITPTKFVFTGGTEDGAAIGLIQYPRFETPAKDLRDHAIQLTEMLISLCNQLSATVVMPEETVWLHTEQKEKSKLP